MLRAPAVTSRRQDGAGSEERPGGCGARAHDGAGAAGASRLGGGMAI